MTTNYAKVSTSKLTNMLSQEISDEARTEINEVLASRQQTSQADEVIVEPVTEAEQAILDQATAAKKAPKLSLKECDALVLTLKENVGKLCQTVAAGTITWADGQIVGVTCDRRNNKVLYMIKLADRRILKAYNSEFLKISDDVQPIVKKTRVQNADGTTTKTKKVIDVDALAARAKEYEQHIGQKVMFVPFKPIPGVETLEGTIIAITPEKRVGKLLIKIRAKVDEMEVIGYKTEGHYDLLEAFDQEVVDAFAKRRVEKTHDDVKPEDRVALCETKLAKAQIELDRWTKTVATRTADLDEARKELAESLAKVEDNILS